MKYFSANFSLIVYTVAFTAQFWLCHALVRKEKSLEQNAEDALPKVTCSSRRMRAVFGPLVQDNLHVKGKGGERERERLFYHQHSRPYIVFLTRINETTFS